MATATLGNLSFIFDEVVSAVAYEEYFSGEFLVPMLYRMQGSASRRERASSLGGLGKFQPKTETGAISEGSVTQQFQKTLTQSEFGLQLPISRMVVDFNEWGLLQEIGIELGSSAAFTMEDDGMALFRDAPTGATYTAEDGLSIANNAHLNVDGGNSQDNLLANTFSMAGVKATHVAMRKFTNYSGDRISVNPDELLVPVDLEEEAFEVVKSVTRPDVANLASNFYQGRYTMYVSPLLTDTNDWAMMDSRRRARNLLWYQSAPLEIFSDGNLNTGTRKVGGYYREAHGCRDWRWIAYNQN